jgi:hypothetical protein
MILQLREASFASEQSALEVGELSAANRVGLAILDLREERDH